MSINVESRPVQGTAGLGSHMYFTLIPIDTTPAEWSVIRGGPTNGNGSPIVGQIDILLQSSRDFFIHPMILGVMIGAGLGSIFRTTMPLGVP